LKAKLSKVEAEGTRKKNFVLRGKQLYPLQDTRQFATMRRFLKRCYLCCLLVYRGRCLKSEKAASVIGLGICMSRSLTSDRRMLCVLSIFCQDTWLQTALGFTSGVPLSAPLIRLFLIAFYA